MLQIPEGLTRKMDSYNDTSRRKKSDKAKEKYERNGAMSKKHIRIIENVKVNTIKKIK